MSALIWGRMADAGSVGRFEIEYLIMEILRAGIVVGIIYETVMYRQKSNPDTIQYTYAQNAVMSVHQLEYIRHNS